MDEKREKSIFQLLPPYVCQLEKFALNVLHTVEVVLTIRIIFSPKALTKANEKTNE